MPELVARNLTLGYGREPIVEHWGLSPKPGTVTTLIGPNGCGKSTALRGLARLLEPRAGSVLLDGVDIHRLPTRTVAQNLGLLPQQADAPGGITVEALVRFGRFPHVGAWAPLGADDEVAVDRALARCGVQTWRNRPVDELSGGQRQRAWLALALAQETPLVLWDEPTTFLDAGHQTEVLNLAADLAREGKTVVLVLHDLAQAARVSHRLVAMDAGKIVADGSPREVLTPTFLERLYGVAFEVSESSGTPVPRPLSRRDLSQPPWSGASAAPSLGARGLSAGYGRVPVVGPLDFDAGPGGLTVILGPNGSGKSTMLRALAGLHPRLEGDLLWDGTPAWKGKKAAQWRAYLTQEAVAPPGVSVQDLVTLGRFPVTTKGRIGDRRAVAEALDALGLGTLAGVPVDHLSGGQRQRVWLALALAQGSPLVLLDEPTSFLDPGHQIELLDALWDLSRRGPRTVIAILHDEDLAARYADRIVRIEEPRTSAPGR